MLTLPFIHCLSQLNSKQKINFLRKIKKSSSKSNINEIKKMINDLGGVDYAQNKIKEFSKLAERELSIFKNSEFKESLLLAVNFNMIRKF